MVPPLCALKRCNEPNGRHLDFMLNAPYDQWVAGLGAGGHDDFVAVNEGREIRTL